MSGGGIMQEAFVKINSIPTRIITCGRWIEESLSHTQEIAIIITGNPGIPGFYTEFQSKLYTNLESKMPIWVIGHLGHDDPPSTSLRQVPQLKGNEELFDLNSQVRHKVEFIRKYVPENIKIHLIGHSIGAWIILQMLQHEDIRTRIKKSYMLFPTVERMIESNNGWIFTKIALPLYWVFGFLITLFSYLPVVLRLVFIRLYFWITSIPNVFFDTVLKYTKPSVLEKVVFLAEDEMAQVRGLPRDIISENRQLFIFYYGTTDGWVPVSYYQQLREQFDNIDARLDTYKIDHAFVLRYSEPMASIVAEMMRQNSNLFQSLDQ